MNICIKKCLLGTLLLISCLQLNAQRCTIPIAADCGIVTAQGGLADGSDYIFCDNSVVNFDNSSTGSPDSTYYCWGDGKDTAVAGTKLASHIYVLPANVACSKTYIIRMTVIKRCIFGTTKFTSSHYIETPIIVKKKPRGTFTGNTVGCTGVSLSLTNTSSCPPTSFKWLFGDGIIDSTNFNTGHIYTRSGTYNLQLVSNGCLGISDTLKKTVTIYDPPISRASAASSSSRDGCGPLTITFNNTSINGNSYKWSVVTGPTGYSFTAPSTSTSPNPTMVFTDTGTYRVRLATTSAFCGASNWDTLIRVQAAPLVSLASIPDACNTLTVRPSQLVTYSKGIPTSYNWTFTNTTPSSSTLRSPADITYPIGTYAITVAATNICGTSSSTINFKVTSPPTGGFTGVVNPPNNCIPADVQLQSNVLNVSSYNWQVISAGGFSYQGGTSSTSANPLLKLTSVGTYQIKMTAIGCSSITKDTTITLITAPSVILDSVANGCLPLTINPGAIVRYTNGTPVSYNWTFTGGSRPSDNVRNPSFVTYNDPGQYSILVGATNTCGTGRDTVTFRVDSLPEVSATLLPDKSIYCAPATITFNNDLKYVYQHQWKINGVGRYRFLSGTNVTSANPVIEFLDEGNYTIQLIGDGCVSDTWTRTIQVLAAPSVKLDSVPTNKCQTTTVNPTAIARFTGGTPSKYLWTFTGQNPDSSTIKNPTTLTYSPGNYSIIARAINACATATDTVRFTVIPAPIVNAAAVFGNPNGCVPVDIDVQSRTQNAATYRWSVLNSTAFSFVNNTNLNSQNAVLRFTNQGSYQIRLNVQGCSAAQWDTTITLISAPSVQLDSVPNSCQALTVNPSAIAHFSGGTPTAYLWTFTGRNPDSSTIRNPSALTYTPGTYSIIARAINACAVATDTVRFLVAAAPVIGAAALFGNPNGCVPIDIDVQSHTQNAATYNWSVLNSTAFSFVNNTTANSQNAVLRFTDQGSYQIRLNVQGCRAAQWDTTITLITSPSVSLGNIPLNCAPYTVFPSSLVSYSGGTPTAYNWNFVGGTPTSSTLRAPISVVFNAIGINKVIVNTSNVCGASTDTTDFILNGPPRANILTSVSDTNQCNPLELTINSSRSAFINTYRWTATGANFINNTSSSSANPVFRFSSAGAYALHLDADGCGSTIWDTTITVIIPPSVLLAKILDTCGQMTINPASIVQYNGGTPSKYTWIFTNTATPNSALRLPPPITYNQAGQYSIIAKTENKCGTSTDTVKFSIRNKPTILITPLPLLCNKDSATQLQVTPLGGLWTGSSVTLNGLFNPTTAPLGINKLYYTYGNGQCLNSDSLSIEVGGAIVQAGAPINICQNETPVVLRGSSPANGIWAGIGIKDSINGVFDPRNLPIGTHTVTYTVKNSRTGCVNQATKDITINAAPRAVFDTLSTGCVGTAVFFQNRSVGIDNATWDFGDNTNTNLLSPSHIYDRSGQFPVWLRVNTVNGCKDSTSRLISVTKIGQPAFAPDRKEGCGPLLAISFNNTTQGQGQNLNYLWDFGTGQRYTTANPPTILFKQSNYDTFYIAKLTVTNTCGAASVTDTIHVRPRPTANFGIRPRNDCSPMVVDFSNASLGYPTSFYWDFDNGRTSRDSALSAQTYLTDTAVRHYNITLIVGNVCGSDTLTRPLTVLPPNAKAFFSIESQQGCAPFTARCINYSSVGSNVWWNSGHGVTSFSNTVFTPTYNNPGFYTITLYAANPNGCGFDSIQHRIEVLAPAKVGFVHAPSVCVGDTLMLRDTSHGFIFRIWHFGDNDSSRILNAIHIYKASGTYTINMLGNTLNGNCAIIRNSQVVVRPLPTANLVLDKTDGCPPLTVAFTNRSTGNAYSSWNFGDGNSTNIITPTHRYDSSGNYSVKLRVTDNYGCSDDTLFNRIVVHDVPKARFTPQADKLCGLPVRVQFNNTSIGAVAYNWNLGNGLTSSTTNPTTSYGVQNTFPIQLIATNSFFCKDTFRTTYKTYNQPFADFSLTPQKGCEPLLVRFQDASVNAVGKRYWSFGDGTTDTLLNPTHLYKAGNYTPKLIISNGNVCFDSLELTRAITVLENPIADFTARDSVTAHPNGIIIFTNNSLLAQSYVWDFNDGSGKVTHVNPTHRYTKTGIYQVSLIAKAANGCLDTIAKPVKPQFFSGLFVPNAFSPESGADEIRKFTVQGLGMKTFKMAIYSAYGDLIWQTDKLADGKPVEGWDGTKNGSPLPQDVYVWKIQATFEDGSIWLGMPDSKGRYYTTGTLTLLK